MKTMDTLTNILQLAKTVESMVQTETLSKQLLQNIGNWVWPLKCMLFRNVNAVKTNVSNQIQKVPVVGNHSKDKGGKKCGNCGHSYPPKQCPAYAKECLKCKKKNHYSKLCQSSDKKPGGGGGNPKWFSRRDVHEVENTEFKYNTDIVEFKWIQFSTPTFNSSQDSPNLQNIKFDEMSESGKLHHVLTDICLENKAGISSRDRLKLDTRASDNLLPVSVYYELFPDHNIKDLGKTFDKSVQLLTATKSPIKKLGTVCLWVYHSQCNFLHTCLFFAVPNKFKPILGLSDWMWLNLVSFNCRVSECWDNDHTSFAFDSCEEKTGTILKKETLVHRPRFKLIFSGVGRFPVGPVNIQLSDDAVPVQKPTKGVCPCL